MRRLLAVGALLAAGLWGLPAAAQTWLRVDARAEVAPPQAGHLKMGASRSRDGHTLEVNSRHLLLDGQPWLPVMGEYHFSRAPASQWDSQLRLMKAAGVDIVATYIFWNHHQGRPGPLDWRGSRDLRRFVRLAQGAGLKVVVRLGPWAHGEARFGGLPDWVAERMPTRGNDAEYLGHVKALYEGISQQLRGLLWKDGGPVVGVQLENEYNLAGPGRGEAHIQTLKALAQQAGMDVPLYTVTGWDGAVYPAGEVVPVFGGYPDEPWSRSTQELPPKETYAFRFGSRVSGDLGAQTQAHGRGTAETDTDQVPFLGAEYGAGLPAMYRRRTLVSPKDIAAMLPVQLGSGVNLLGYYMFHGGRNPTGPGGSGLEESTASGGYNDTPTINYDFQAPLGPDGQPRPVLGQLRPWHYFLNQFGPALATMTVRRPEVTPTSPADLATPRWAVRSFGDSGFLFFNNHVRQYPMPVQAGVRFEVALPGGTLQLPSHPVDLADGLAFVWPLNLDLDGVLLRYATAQPVTRVDAGPQGIVHVFAATPGVDAEFALPQGLAQYTPDATRLQPIGTAQGRPVSVLLLPPEALAQLTVLDLVGQRRLVLSAQQAWAANGRLQLRGPASEELRASVFPALPHPSAPGLKLAAAGVFQQLQLPAAPIELPLQAQATRPAGAAPRILKGGHANAAVQPGPEAFGSSATWTLRLPAVPHQAEEVLLSLDIVGDIGRLHAGTALIDDWYYSGQGWELGLRQRGLAAGGSLNLSVLPLRSDAPIYIDRAHRPAFSAGQTQVAELRGARLVALRRVEIRP